MEERGSMAANVMKTAGEALLVAVLVFALGWGGMKLAEHRQDSGVAAGKDGVIWLSPRHSNWHGGASFVEENKYYGYWKCEGQWDVGWRFQIAERGRYDVQIEANCSADAGEIVVRIDERDYKLTITPYAKAVVLPGGPVELGPGTHPIQVSPAEARATAVVNLRSITIRPAAASTQPGM